MQYYNDDMEKETHEKVLGIVTYVFRYCETFWDMLFHPKRTLSTANSGNLTKPGAFLVANIVLSFLIAQFINYEISTFPIDNPALQRLTGFSFVFIRYLFGIAVFLMLLKKSMKWKNMNAFVASVFPILCYSSVVYFPNLIIKSYYHDYVAKDFFNIMSRAISGTPLNISILTVFEILGCLMLPIIFLCWWLRLVYLGLSLKEGAAPGKLKKGLALSVILFFIIQATLSLLLFFKMNLQTIKGFLLLADTKRIVEEVNENSPNYLKAIATLSVISENEDMPEYIRYITKLSKVVCEIGFGKGDQHLIDEAKKGLKEEHYDYVLDILVRDLNSRNSGNDYYKSLVRKDIEDAVKFRNSPSYLDFRKEHIRALSFSFTTMHFTKPIHMISIDKNGNKTMDIMAPIPPSLIALFP